MHLASTTGVPVSTTTCPVLGDTCLVSVPGRPIADVVNLQVNVGLHTAVLVTIKAKFNKTFVCVPFRHANIEMETHRSVDVEQFILL